MLSFPSSPVPVALAALLAGLAAARVLRPDPAAPVGPWRSAAVHGVPAIATAAIAVVVWTTPVGTWAPATAGVLGLAAILAPFASGLRVRSRAPTPAEAEVLRRASGESGNDRTSEEPGDVRLTDADGIAGYAAGTPLTGTVVVSAGALAALPPRAVAALLAHERAHCERRHASLPGAPARPGARTRRGVTERPSSNRRAYPGDGPTGRMNRQALLYALLFSVPPGIGMTGFSMMATTGGLINPIAALIGIVTWGIIFAFVYVAATRGNPDESRSPGAM